MGLVARELSSLTKAWRTSEGARSGAQPGGTQLRLDEAYTRCEQGADAQPLPRREVHILYI